MLSDPVTIDNAGPAAPTVTLDVTSGRTRSATWSVTPSEDGTTRACRLTRTAPDGSTSLVKDWSPCSDYTFALLQGDGTYRLEVRSLDALGNVGAGQVGPGYLLDATPPPPPTVTGSRTGTGSATAVTYTFSGEGTATCRLEADGTVVQTWADCHLAAQPFAVTLPRTSATYVLTVVLTDSFGNASTAGRSLPYVLDVTPPDAPTVTGSRTGTASARSIDYVFAGEGTARCRLYRDGVLVQTFEACQAPQPFAVTLPATSGSYVLVVTLTDAYGNTGASGSSLPYVLDVTPPSGPTVTSAVTTGNDPVATWTVVVPEAGTTSECRLHHTPVTGPATVSAWAPCAAPYRRSLTLGDGSYVLEVRLTDAYGNTGPGVEGTPYVLDTTPPAAPTVGS